MSLWEKIKTWYPHGLGVALAKEAAKRDVYNSSLAELFEAANKICVSESGQKWIKENPGEMMKYQYAVLPYPKITPLREWILRYEAWVFDGATPFIPDKAPEMPEIGLPSLPDIGGRLPSLPSLGGLKTSLQVTALFIVAVILLIVYMISGKGEKGITI